MSVTASFEGALVLQLALRRMRALGEAPRPIFEAIGQYGETSTRIRFQRGVGPDGQRWLPSARVRASGGQTLVQQGSHGGLLGSITYQASNTSAEWGSNKVYAGIHQFGGVIRPRNKANLRFQVPGVGFISAKRVVMPARPFLGINAEDDTEIQAVVLDVIEAAEMDRRL